MRLHNLKNAHRGKDIYIVGTGPSLRTFPLGYLGDKITIGLNQAWKYFSPTYSITVHPELVVEYESYDRPPITKWIVKRKPPFEKLSFTDKRYFLFNTVDKDFTIFHKPKEDHLFIGRGVQQTAMHVASIMGAASIILVGVDMTDLCGDHHGHDQHVRFHGLPPADVYLEYRRYTAAVRYELRKKGLKVLTLSGLLGACDGSEDYERLCKELKLQKLPPPEDTSTYKRKAVD